MEIIKKNSNDLLLSHTLLEGLRKLERCRSRSLALVTYTEEVLHIPCLTKPASILCSQVRPKPLAMTLSRLGCCPLLWRDYFDPSFWSPIPVILAWFPSFALWVIFDLCRYRNTKRAMLTTFAEMQELGRQVESVSSHSKVSILYSVSCRADLSERSILNYTIPQSASIRRWVFLPLNQFVVIVVA